VALNKGRIFSLFKGHRINQLTWKEQEEINAKHILQLRTAMKLVFQLVHELKLIINKEMGMRLGGKEALDGSHTWMPLSKCDTKRLYKRSARNAKHVPQIMLTKKVVFSKYALTYLHYHKKKHTSAVVLNTQLRPSLSPTLQAKDK
jgi:hypothetical protein